jgi:hypothetical protein
LLVTTIVASGRRKHMPTEQGLDMRRSRRQQASIICLRAERMNRGLRLFTFDEAFA